VTKKNRGIVDPWRSVDMLRPAPAPAPVSTRKKINLDEIDHDADLAIPGKYALRFKHVCFNMTSVRIHVSGDALDVFADCVSDLYTVRVLADLLKDAGIGVQRPGREWNVPAPEVPASTLKSKTACLWFIGETLDIGTLALARVMRSPHAAAALRRHGVVVMLTAS